ncbi:hypothetical protein CDD83_10395 [Cordyceps sp. RAO-2017]|nr:hypothetical protein CDD83_10395 [Cordyceps sp. RAO-2017]
MATGPDAGERRREASVVKADGAGDGDDGRRADGEAGEAAEGGRAKGGGWGGGGGGGGPPVLRDVFSSDDEAPWSEALSSRPVERGGEERREDEGGKLGERAQDEALCGPACGSKRGTSDEWQGERRLLPRGTTRSGLAGRRQLRARTAEAGTVQGRADRAVQRSGAAVQQRGCSGAAALQASGAGLGAGQGR